MNAALAYILLWCPQDKEATSENCPLTIVLLWLRHHCRSHRGPNWETGWWMSIMWTAIPVSPKNTTSTWSTAATYTGGALTVRKPCPLSAWDMGQYFTRALDEPLHMLRDNWNIRKKNSKEMLHGGVSPSANKRQWKENRASFCASFTSSCPKMVSLNWDSDFSRPRSFVEQGLQCQFWD